MITRDQSRFLRAAICKDELRMHIARACAVDVAGRRWLVATDGHRLHAVAAPEGVALGYVVVTPDGTVAPLDWPHTFPPVTQVWFSELEKSAKKIALDRLRAASSGNEETRTGFGSGDDLYLPTITTRFQAGHAGSVYVSGPYLADALLAAPRPTSKHPDAGCVLVGRDGPLDAIVVLEDAPLPAWRAVIMPVRA